MWKDKTTQQQLWKKTESIKLTFSRHSCNDERAWSVQNIANLCLKLVRPSSKILKSRTIWKWRNKVTKKILQILKFFINQFRFIEFNKFLNSRDSHGGHLRMRKVAIQKGLLDTKSSKNSLNEAFCENEKDKEINFHEFFVLFRLKCFKVQECFKKTYA